ncbi:MAG: DUF1311 domain-containing protein [Magnetococcales bacterium]|nr:DUF1311 domain-containing protein [Magnetococcales bacterium]MBF0150394.1 DUF1311 domain-containing protein [Magnetococcales bacterium]
MRWIQWVWFLLMAVFSTPSDAAPSFDCNRARLPIESLICQDEALARLDGEMGAAFIQAKKNARDVRVDLIQKGQRQWLSERLQHCNISNKRGEDPDDPKAAVACLTPLYQQRIRDLTASSTDTIPGVEWANPTGVVKQVRQVTVRFTHPMVPMGDPRLDDPFIIQCPWKGKGRWADSRNWIFDFDRDLPAGILCSFALKKSLNTLAGQPLAQTGDFSFSTGGPAILQAFPAEGNHEIDEEQVFILGLDTAADPSSIQDHVHCQISGIAENIGVRLLTPEERAPLIRVADDLVDYYQDRALGKGENATAIDLGSVQQGEGHQNDLLKLLDAPSAPLAAVQCKRHLPPGTEVSLVWGKGVQSRSGVATEEEQVLRFKVREPFQARFSCNRTHKDADCLPICPLQLYFNAPIARTLAEQIVLKGTGERRQPRIDDDESSKSEFVQWIHFPQPFPENSEFFLELPNGIKDDSGRDLVNQREFPLKIRIDELPPLAKFPASFGIIEAKGEPALPVTLRHLETFVSEDPNQFSSSRAEKQKGPRINESTPATEPSEIRGRMLRVVNPGDFPGWMKRINEVQWGKSHWDPEQQINVTDQAIGEVSVFTSTDHPSLSTFILPKPNGAKAFEVMGIPMPKPGFYVVELASQRLGAALHGTPKPYHVQTAALVTHMAAHFFRGRESSLVWVTELDSGHPVAGAEVTVSDCNGKVFVRGNSDRDGLLKIELGLPEPYSLPDCPTGDRAFLIAARLGEDVTFVMSTWNNGIERYSFNLPSNHQDKPYRIHTVLDRSLFRAGETVHMKHLMRIHDRRGFSLPDKKSLPGKVRIQHAGGSAEYDIPLSWNEFGSAESTFELPKEAKPGTYDISIGNVSSGHFRVEAFRVPLMQGLVKPVATDLVRPSRAEVDLQVNYLAGGPAANIPVKVRGMRLTRKVTFPDHEDFEWANGEIKEGLRSREQPRDDEEVTEEASTKPYSLPVVATHLGPAGGGRVTLGDLGTVKTPKSLLVELEYLDPNGEIMVSSAQMNLWPTAVVVGIKPDRWMQSRESIRVKVMTVDLHGKPKGGVPVVLELFKRKTFSHRKRLLGGFYSYDQHDELTRIKEWCSGKSDEQGTFSCEGEAPGTGSLVAQARVMDEGGNVGHAHTELWVPTTEDTWFGASDGDRMDLLPEKRRYEPGEKAAIQVRMPFRDATGLVVVEREGVMETFVQPLSGQSPRVDVPILGNYGPNVFVAVLAVRGRTGEIQPTALIDMGRPAMRLGITQLQVGWRDYELNVGVTADRAAYQTRETADVTVTVHRANGKPLPSGGEIALAAVDEGLLALYPNDSWKLLEGMLSERGLEVETATAMGRVVGRRHFGRKAVPQGGSGGRKSARELFETLLLWQGRVKLDASGMARVKVPLNDSITSFRIMAVATAGVDLFGSGSTIIRVSREVVLFSGLPPVVREGDHFRAGFTIRNAGEKPVQGKVRALVKPEGVGSLPAQKVTLAPGEAQEVFWEVTVPTSENLSWDVEADMGGVQDRVKVTQEVKAAIPVRVLQSTLSQLEGETRMDWAMPAGALPGRGGIGVSLTPSLASGLTGVREYMLRYPYTCMEQQISKAVSLEDRQLWDKIVASLPSYLDGDGLLKYFPQMSWGNDTLTSYLLAVAETAGLKIPEKPLASMKKGLLAFVEGRIHRDSSLATADLTMRRIAALAALARYDHIDPKLVGSISAEPNLWPTSTVVDWIDLLNRVQDWPEGDARKDQALHILRSRLNFSGSTMSFSTEASDYFWWLMVSTDVNANRAILAVLKEKGWREDVGRMMRGSLFRRQEGHWSTSVANAWGTLAARRFGSVFEGERVSGTTTSRLAEDQKEFDWSNQPRGGQVLHPWPQGTASLRVRHQGKGKPWLTVESRAAIPLTEPLLAGYRVKRTVTAVERKREGEWHRGDVYRVHLELEAQGDMTWVVVADPIPAGSSILGGGLGKDSATMTAGEQSSGSIWPAFTERNFESYRAYYEWVPKGTWQVEYTLRLNNAGDFQLPSTRVEAMYAPEQFAEIPNANIIILP